MGSEVENLVTGGTGFIGSHLVKLLIEKGEEVALLSRSGGKGALLRHVNSPKLRVIKADLEDYEGLRKALPRPQKVYHLAGMVRTSRYLRDRVFRANYLSTLNLMRALEEKIPEKMVYLASIFALGKGTREKPACEDVEYNLEEMARTIPYFSAKLQAQMIVETYIKRGFPIVMVYPCFCVGPGDVYLSSSGFVLHFMRGLIKFYWDGGINLMDVRDCALGLYLGMQKGRVGRRYLIGGENLTFRTIFEMLAEITGVSPPSIKIPSFLLRAGSRLMELVLGRRAIIDSGTARIITDYWYYSDERARRELGYSSRQVWEALRESVEWFRLHRDELIPR